MTGHKLPPNAPPSIAVQSQINIPMLAFRAQIVDRGMDRFVDRCHPEAIAGGLDEDTLAATGTSIPLCRIDGHRISHTIESHRQHAGPQLAVPSRTVKRRISIMSIASTSEH